MGRGGGWGGGGRGGGKWRLGMGGRRLGKKRLVGGGTWEEIGEGEALEKEVKVWGRGDGGWVKGGWGRG